MGEIISLAQAQHDRLPGRHVRPGRRSARVVFFFDLGCPFTYLAAERVERMLDNVEWRPAFADALLGGSPVSDSLAGERVRRAARERAAALRLPLVWPDRYPSPLRAAMRAAAYAAEQGRGGSFALAASRLAFCGGFDLDDPEVLAEAAAAAGIGLTECLAAGGDPSRDGAMEAAGRRLLASGADRLPALRVGRLLFAGEGRVAEAAAAARRPLALA
jgi:2-hydroxychromene-2-carboxylate isomerase